MPPNFSNDDQFKINSQGSAEEEKEQPRKSIKGEIQGRIERGNFYNTLERVLQAPCKPVGMGLLYLFKHLSSH